MAAIIEPMGYRAFVRLPLAALTTAMLVGLWPAREGRAQAPDSAMPLVGAWTLNKELSDSPQDASGDRDDGSRPSTGNPAAAAAVVAAGAAASGVAAAAAGGGGQVAPTVDPQETARIRDAMRDILNPPDHLTIVQTESMVIVTGPDGRTTRLSPDGKKIKDDSTKIDRRTKWDGGKLVSEIGGLPVGKVTETWSVDPERRQLHISLKNDDDKRPLMVTRVYDADAR